MEILKNIDKNAPTDMLKTKENQSISSSESSSESEQSFLNESSSLSDEDHQVGKKRKISCGSITNRRKIKKNS